MNVKNKRNVKEKRGPPSTFAISQKKKATVSGGLFVFPFHFLAGIGRG